MHADVRKYWRHPGFWRWWWGARVSGQAKAVTAVLFAVVVGAAGFLSAARLAPGQVAATLTTKTVLRAGTAQDDSRAGAPRVVTDRRTETVFQTETTSRLTTVTTPRRTDTVTTEVPRPQRTVTERDTERVTVTDAITVTETVTELVTVTETFP